MNNFSDTDTTRRTSGEAAPASAIATQKADGPRSPPSEVHGAGPILEILVADDDPVVRYTVVRFLERAGYRVTTASDGEEAWAILQARRIQLLITDNNMPRLTGVDLIQRLRAEDRTLPAILASGTLAWDDETIPPEWRPLMVLEKPYGAEEVLPLIDQAARGAAERAAAAEGRGPAHTTAASARPGESRTALESWEGEGGRSRS